MNHYTGYELLWLFFIYSFGGWVLETISATLKQRKFANRGLVNGRQDGGIIQISNGTWMDIFVFRLHYFGVCSVIWQ